MHLTLAATLSSLISLAAVVRAGNYDASWETCQERQLGYQPHLHDNNRGEVHLGQATGESDGLWWRASGKWGVVIRVRRSFGLAVAVLWRFGLQGR